MILLMLLLLKMVFLPRVILIGEFGWGREGYNQGAWNTHLGTIIAGTGDIFSVTGEELTSGFRKYYSSSRYKYSYHW